MTPSGPLQQAAYPSPIFSSPCVRHPSMLQALLSSRTVSSFSTPASTARLASARIGHGGTTLSAPPSARNQGELPIRRPPAEQGPTSGGGGGSGGDAVGAAAGAAAGSPLRNSSPLRGRRLAPRGAAGCAKASGSAASAAAAAAGAGSGAVAAAGSEGSNRSGQAGEAGSGSPHQPRPPQGPKPPGGSPQRRAPAVPRLSLLPHTPQQPAAPVPALTLAPVPPPPQPQPPGAAAAPVPQARAEACESPVHAACEIEGGSVSGSPLQGSSPWSGTTPEPPQPTGDLSEDFAAIEEWEERTGKVYQFKGLSDAEDEAPDEAPGGDADEGEDEGAGAGAEGRSGVGGADEGGGDKGASGGGEAPAAGRAPVPPLALGVAPPAASPLRLPLQKLPAGWGPAGAEAGVGSGSPGAASTTSSGYRPGYDLEEDFARGYIPEGMESDASSAGGLIPAGREGSQGLHAAVPGAGDGRALLCGGDEWGSSSGDDGDEEGGSSEGGEIDAGERGGWAAVAAVTAADDGLEVSPSRRIGLVPSLNLSLKLPIGGSPARAGVQAWQQEAAQQWGQREGGRGDAGRGEGGAGGEVGAVGVVAGFGAAAGLPAGRDGGVVWDGAEGEGTLLDPVLASYRKRRQVRGGLGG